MTVEDVVEAGAEAEDGGGVAEVVEDPEVILMLKKIPTTEILMMTGLMILTMTHITGNASSQCPRGTDMTHTSEEDYPRLMQILMLDLTHMRGLRQSFTAGDLGLYKSFS